MPIDNKQFNARLVQTLKTFRHTPSPANGHGFEDYIEQFFSGGMNLPSLKKRDIESNPNYLTIIKKIGSKDFDLVGMGLEDGFYTQMSGDQKWPDVLLVHNEIGLPIEAKSSKTRNSILWNGGVPSNDALYIYNFYKEHQITYFLGQDAITEEERIELDVFHTMGKLLNKGNFYVRNMHNLKNTFIEGGKVDYNKQATERVAREENVYNFIKNLTWDRNQTTNFNSPEYVIEQEHIDKVKNVFKEIPFIGKYYQ